ncbi:helix-turn-helix domain-containing protein [Neisseria dumasiana]|uniref:Transposase n=1 Tax=Neisseria dumasiana TaxID=1931275 RepID=A0ABX3WJ61_9NEIS|nr:helix-turn-helix domain-containing protein [Neisseria dumasiana]OSI25296.1 transposase [Neisseria dumasiana]OSI25635.1 transposase [Neisseria dumasiana]UOO83913.1 helix-turn-helix domain containing protein [Neisseria dumasiana]UOO84596.1 helix-turn-helix domain containing protein [Neisseria dumasiana]
MSKYTPDFKYRAVLHYHQVRSQQRTAEHLNVSRTHLRRWIAAYRQGGIAALQHPQAHSMKTKRKNPFIVDKPDHEKTQAELIEELRYMRAENDYLKHMKAFNEKEENAAKAAKPFKN